MILQPIIYMYTNGNIEKINFELSLEPNNFHSIVIRDFKLQNAPILDSTQANSGQIIQIAQCDNATLPDNFKCAPQDKIDSFMVNYKKIMIIKMMLQQFNSQNMKVETIINELYIFIDQKSTYYSQITLKLQTAIIDDGLLFQNIRQLTYLNDFSFLSQNIPINRAASNFDQEIYSQFFLSLSPNISQQFVQYPKFNEVLADTGSIIELIFYMSILAKLFNEVFFEQDTLNQIISLYYPEFPDLKIKSNFLGQIKEVYLKNKQLDKDKFIIYYKKLKTIAKDKITVRNIIYEISRLQFTIQNLQDRSYIIKSHQYGIQFNQYVFDNRNSKVNQSLEIQNFPELENQEDDFNLTDQDFDLLSLKHLLCNQVLDQSILQQ